MVRHLRHGPDDQHRSLWSGRTDAAIAIVAVVEGFLVGRAQRTRLFG